MTKVLGILAVKGGVGKTAVSASLASELVKSFGKKVLLVDANYSAPNIGLHMDILEPKGSIHEVLGGKSKIGNAIHTKFGVDVIPGSFKYSKRIDPFKLKKRLEGIKDNYDFVIIDSAPGLNEEILSTVLASDNLFLVSTPDYPTLSCSLKATKLVRQRGKGISGIILNKIRDPNYEVDAKDIEEVTGIPVVAKIPEESKHHARALFNRLPVSIHNNKSKFSKEISRLCAAISNVGEKRPVIDRVFPTNYRREEVNRQLLRNSFK